MSFEPPPPSLLGETGPDNGGRALSFSTADKARHVKDGRLCSKKGVLDGRESRETKIVSGDSDESSESPLSFESTSRDLFPSWITVVESWEKNVRAP